MAKFYNIRYKQAGKKRKGCLYLTSFSNGRLKTEEEEEPKVEFQVYAKTSEDYAVGKKRRIVVANTSRMCYTGSSYDNESARNCNYFLCLVNKNKNKMKVYDTNLYCCKPLLDIDDGIDDKKEKSYKEKVDDLTSTFGSKAKKRSLKSRTKYHVGEEAIEASISSAVDESLTNDDGKEVSHLHSSTDERNILLPQINREAEDLRDVYNLYEIITREEHEQIESEALELMRATDSDIETWKENNQCSQLVLNFFENKRNEFHLDKAKLLAYYNYLVKFNRLGYKDLHKRDPCPEIPEPFKSSLLDRFVIKSVSSLGRFTRSIPPRMRDKIYAFALVLSLFICDFKVDLPLFQSDFKCGTPKLMKITYALACHVTYKKNENDLQSKRFAELKFPLFVPKESSFMGKKGRKK